MTPLEITAENAENIFDDYKIPLANAMVEAVAYGIENNLNLVIFSKVTLGYITFCLELDPNDYDNIISKCILVLEEGEDYISCANALKTKEHIIKLKNNL